MSEARVGVPESLGFFFVDNGCAGRRQGRKGGLGVGLLSDFWFQLEAISTRIDGEGMVVCSLWGWPVRKGLPREVWESLISLFPPLIQQVGCRMHVQITRIDEAKNDLVLSEKEAWELLYLKGGTLLEGTVKKIFPYGAQVRIGETDRSLDRILITAS